MPDILTGWAAVAAVGLVLLVLTIAACGIAVRGLFSTLAVAALSFPAMWLLARYVFGDVSRYLPVTTFSEGADGKDQVIVASILCTILGGVIAAACLVWLLTRLDGVLNRRNKSQAQARRFRT